MIYLEKPENFNSKFDVVNCFIECGDEILLLHRQDHKKQPDTWCLPGGKVDDGETVPAAMVRELAEETAVELPESQLKYVEKFYAKYPGYDYIYHLFKTRLEVKPEVATNSEEHKDWKWVTPMDALSMKLIQDGDAVLKHTYEA